MAPADDAFTASLPTTAPASVANTLANVRAPLNPQANRKMNAQVKRPRKSLGELKPGEDEDELSDWESMNGGDKDDDMIDIHLQMSYVQRLRKIPWASPEYEAPGALEKREHKLLRAVSLVCRREARTIQKHFPETNRLQDEHDSALTRWKSHYEEKIVALEHDRNAMEHMHQVHLVA